MDVEKYKKIYGNVDNANVVIVYGDVKGNVNNCNDVIIINGDVHGHINNCDNVAGLLADKGIERCNPIEIEPGVYYKFPECGSEVSGAISGKDTECKWR